MKLNLSISLIICLSILALPVMAEETPFTVDFSANVTDGYAPMAVQFNNLATGNQVSGFWEINNETITQLTGPEYTFIIPGYYNISLTVTDDTNTTATETKLDYILVRSSVQYTALSFSSSGIWGSNPVLITDKSNGEIVFVGKTSSKNIMLDSAGEYSIQVQPGGITDTINAPDYGLAVAMDWGKNNLIGIFIGGAFVLIILGIFFRR